MRFPVVIVNFKAYKEGTGENAVKLAKIAESVAGSSGKEVVIAPNPLDLYRVISSVDSLPVFSQHADPVTYGAHTGHISPIHLKELGVSGTLLNHSERKLELDTLLRAASLSHEVGLDVVVCVSDPEELKAVAENSPPITALAYEPPELIGTGKAVSKYKPDVLLEAVDLANKYGYRLLCGAGIVNGDDVRKARELGAEGVLVASGVVKSKDPRASLEDLVSGI